MNHYQKRKARASQARAGAAFAAALFPAEAQASADRWGNCRVKCDDRANAEGEVRLVAAERSPHFRMGACAAAKRLAQARPFHNR